jgi:hypothetical protein
MNIELIAWEYTPTPKQAYGKEVKVNNYDEFKKEFVAFNNHLKDINDMMNLSGLIETRVADVKDKDLAAIWRAKAADEIFFEELTKEESYA